MNQIMPCLDEIFRRDMLSDEEYDELDEAMQENPDFVPDIPEPMSICVEYQKGQFHAALYSGEDQNTLATLRKKEKVHFETTGKTPKQALNRLNRTTGYFFGCSGYSTEKLDISTKALEPVLKQRGKRLYIHPISSSEGIELEASISNTSYQATAQYVETLLSQLNSNERVARAFDRPSKIKLGE